MAIYKVREADMVARKLVYTALIFAAGFIFGWGLQSTGVGGRVWTLSEKSIAENFETLKKRMSAYHEQFHEFTPDLSALGFTSTGSNIVVYTEANQVLKIYQRRLLPDEIPMTKADSYLALLVATDIRSGEISFWVGDETGEFEKLDLKLSSDLVMMAD